MLVKSLEALEGQPLGWASVNDVCNVTELVLKGLGHICHHQEERSTAAGSESLTQTSPDNHKGED